MRSLLASLRLANAPSVVSNVTLGFLLGVWYWGFRHQHQTWGSLAPLSLLATLGVLLLFAGNLLNDWYDREWDATHRPERALPSGKFRPASYLIGGVSLLTLALLLAAFLGPAVFLNVLLISSCIVLYTWAHKRHLWAVLPMAACRAGLYGLGFLALSPVGPWGQEQGTALPLTQQISEQAIASSFLLTHALGLFSYLCGLSLSARYESLGTPPPGMTVLARALLGIPVAALSAWWMPSYPLWTLLGLIPFLGWLALTFSLFRKPLPRFVSALLAGIPLIDWIACVPAATSTLMPGEKLSGHPLVIAGVTLPLLAFGLGRWLQRIAPAT
ncbi:4-hydroxybenzoate polyprenyltransferase [Haloferula luteola]|uniref:4-hydroxybenzoate polyprenyltransferase n=1 Tax=Haloferula luteola TaxID=595692 RepID=A0A840V717_9BACT|nr:UbiA family prenyltransferase [Haloferula luteola]MBB5353772.1 4-hydroxybenzoate polyprenyltransferase [Haloferula luteola]